MKYDASMTHWLLSVLCLVQCMVSLTAVRYGDYSVPHMPQYSDRHEDSDLAPGHDEYNDRSLDAPAHLDYKYEEEPHERSDDLSREDIVDEMIWDKSLKKKKKPSILLSKTHSDLDRYSLHDAKPELKSDREFGMNRSKFRKRNFAKQSEFQRHLKRISINQNDEIDDLQNNSDDVHQEDLERDDGIDTVKISQYRYRSTSQRKPRRKARDRALHQPERRESDNNANIERGEMESRAVTENFEIQNPRRFEGIFNQENVNRKHNYDYNEYYDMKRVQHMKSRLPALLKQSTVRTVEQKSTSYSGHWLHRRANSPAEHVVTESIGLAHIFAVANTTLTSTKSTTKSTTTSVTEVTLGNTSELSLAEKSRLSILKKVHRKESLRNVSSATKPPVLMQVTRKMQTMVMVAPRSPEIGMRAREVFEDSPERLQRARRLMRHKLVVGARSIHELTDNWDEMICDYIDVALLDTDAAFYMDHSRCVIVLLFLLF